MGSFPIQYFLSLPSEIIQFNTAKLVQMSILPNPNESTAAILGKLCILFLIAVIIQTALTSLSAILIGTNTELITELSVKSEQIASSGDKSPENLQNTLIYGAQEIKQQIGKRDYLFIYIAQVSYNVLCFLIIGLLFRKKSFNQKDLKPDWQKNKISLYILCPLLLLTSLPLLGETLKLNELFGFNAIGNYFGIDLTTKSLGNMIFSYAVFVPETTFQLITSILFVSIVPAFGEELFFRGGLQKFLYSRFNNPHNAIFITALIFSALHFEITAFFYRFLLGVILGYVYFWGKTIWLPILIHGLNNSFSVISMYFMFNINNIEDLSKKSETINNTPTDPTSLVFSTILFSIILWNFYMNYKQENLIKN